MDMRLTAQACDTTATGNAYAALTAKAAAPEMAAAPHAFGMAATAKASAVSAATTATAVRH
ncbi:hypothetical protein [Mesorhizobium sp. 113-1-2]|uniref:hypothetical protein n=1 Tax=Mesorhizobium sp. 113-1-2 TaxID=2744515 RepID=UPI00192548D1|nr:hypothetical protein [Mesorhizobium sp. 113-1-2]